MTHNMIGLLQPNGEVKEYGNTNGGGGGSSKPVKVSYDTSPATKVHAVDSFIYYNDSVYKVTSAISIGDTLTVGTNISIDIGLEADTEICIDGLPNSSSNDKNFIGTRAQWEALTTAQQNAYDTVDLTDEDGSIIVSGTSKSELSNLIQGLTKEQRLFCTLVINDIVFSCRTPSGSGTRFDSNVELASDKLSNVQYYPFLGDDSYGLYVNVSKLHSSQSVSTSYGTISSWSIRYIV